jgi:hypothetical protein
MSACRNITEMIRYVSFRHWMFGYNESGVGEGRLVSTTITCVSEGLNGVLVNTEY